MKKQSEKYFYNSSCFLLRIAILLLQIAIDERLEAQIPRKRDWERGRFSSWFPTHFAKGREMDGAPKILN
jgi:hypothetical protein